MIGFVSSYYFTIFLYLVKIKKFRKSLKVKLLRNSIRLISIKIQFRLQPSALRSFTLAVFSKSRFPAKTQAFFLFSICLQTISKDIPPYFFE